MKITLSVLLVSFMLWSIGPWSISKWSISQSLWAEEMTNSTTNKYTLAELVEYLALEGHIEGGFFRRTYQADNRDLIATESGDRYSMTSIYYLLSAESPVGHFHLNKSDIVHYFQLGDAIEYFLIFPDGRLERRIMGNDLGAGQLLQMTVPGGVWKASRILAGGEYGYSLISEAVSPGFDYADMTLGQQSALIELFPQHSDLFSELSR